MRLWTFGALTPVGPQRPWQSARLERERACSRTTGSAMHFGQQNDADTEASVAIYSNSRELCILNFLPSTELQKQRHEVLHALSTPGAFGRCCAAQGLKVHATLHAFVFEAL